jgi:hypothetical protein
MLKYCKQHLEAEKYGFTSMLFSNLTIFPIQLHDVLTKEK